MPKRTRNYRPIDGFEPDAKLREWTSENFPAIDIDATFEVFRDKALAADWVYASWGAAWRNYLRNSKKYEGVVYKRGLDDPKMQLVLHEARKVGFRDPSPVENVSTYRSALERFKANPPQPHLRGLDISALVKRVPH